MMIYGILHLDAEETSAHNVKVADFQDQVEIYLKNAALLSESLRLYGMDYTLLTNMKKEICSISEILNRDIDVIEIPFATEVPSGLKFFSAHFKIDALKYIASTSDEYSLLCDLDVVCVNEMPNALKNIVKKNLPLFYDISDQVIPAYGHSAIISDISRISGTSAQGRWAGGEFIAGPPEFFAELHSTIQDIWPKYLSESKSLHHIGDEAVLSAAIQIMLDKGVQISDAGTLGIIGRFWSGNIKHYQRSIMHYKDNFLLHLPADKRFLANFMTKDIGDFFKVYKIYLGKKVIHKYISGLKRKFKFGG